MFLTCNLITGHWRVRKDTNLLHKYVCYNFTPLTCLTPFLSLFSSVSSHCLAQDKAFDCSWSKQWWFKWDSPQLIFSGIWIFGPPVANPCLGKLRKFVLFVLEKVHHRGCEVIPSSAPAFCLWFKIWTFSSHLPAPVVMATRCYTSLPWWSRTLIPLEINPSSFSKFPWPWCFITATEK